MEFRTTNYQPASSTGDEIDLRAIFAVLRDHKFLISTVAAVTLALGIGYALLATPLYRATAMIQVADSSGAVNDKLGDLAQLFNSKATADAEIELIRSRELIDDTVRHLHLDIHARPRYLPLIGSLLTRGATPGQLVAPPWGLDGFAWGGEDVKIAQFDVPPKLYDQTFKLTVDSDQAFALIGPDGNVVLKGRTGTPLSGMTDYGPVRLTVTSLVARTGTAFKLARASTQITTQNLQKTLDISENVKQSGIISVRLDGADSERTSDTVNAIVRGYVQRNVAWKSAQAQQMLSFLSHQLPQLKTDLEDSEQRYNTFRDKNRTLDLTEESRLLLQSIVDGKTRIITLQQQRAELLQRFTPSHPSVAAVDQQLAGLQREQDQLGSKVTTLPDTQQTAVRLMRDVSINTALYVNLMNSAQQLRVLKAGQQGDVHIVDSAVISEQPVKPKKAVIVAVSAVLGLLLGVAAAFLRRALNAGMEDTIEIEETAGVPIYAVIPHSDHQLKLERSFRRGGRRQHVLAMASPEDMAVEGIRSLRTALLFRMADAANNVVMIAGPRPNIGKSFLSINLATVFATAGKRVLLVDADLRRGDIHSYFGKSRDPGLQDVMAGAAIEGAVRRQVLPNLDLLSRGTVSRSPSEALMSDRLGQIIERLASAYDVVIVDTPPVLAATDSTLIGKHAGTTLLVMRHGRHSATELRESMRLLGSSGVVVKGVVLTDVPERSSTYGTYSPYTSVKD